jgi:hypothetical protein
MPRFIARLILTLLLAPASIVGGFMVFGAFELLFRGSWVSYTLSPILATLLPPVAGLCFFLIWRSVIPWSKARRQRSIRLTALLFALLVVAVAVWPLTMESRYDWQPWSIFSSAGITVVWGMLCCRLWQETPRERIERLMMAATSSCLCPVCRYDMAGLTNLQCPECGQKFTLGLFQEEQRRRVAPSALS